MFRELKVYISTCFALAFSGDGKTQFALNMIVPLTTAGISNWIDVSWLVQNVVARSAQVAAGVFSLNMLFVSPFKIYRKHIAELERLKHPIRLSFANEAPFVARDRPGYADDRIALRLDTKRRLAQVQCWVMRVCRIESDGSIGEQMNGITRFLLGMPHGAQSWDPKDISSYEYVIAFLHKNQKLKVFTNVDYSEFRGWKDDLPHGKYRFELEIDSPSLETSIAQTIDVSWNGNIGDLIITIN